MQFVFPTIEPLFPVPPPVPDWIEELVGVEVVVLVMVVVSVAILYVGGCSCIGVVGLLCSVVRGSLG